MRNIDVTFSKSRMCMQMMCTHISVHGHTLAVDPISCLLEL